jgi:hypothetical protein
MEVTMKTIQLNSVAIALLVPLLILLGNNMPDSVAEGPFNHDLSQGFFSDEGMVSNTLYHNNKTDYVTVWDEAAGKYVTYDQNSGEALSKVVFNAEEHDSGKSGRTMVAGWNGKVRGGGKVVIVETKAVPTTHLDEEGMKIQAKYGCAGCHTM